MKEIIMKRYILIILILGIIFSNLISASEKSEVYRRIKEAIDNIWIIDTHEHLMPEKERLSRKIDFFYLFPQYVSSDLVSAGMSMDDLFYIRDPEQSLDLRWEKFYPYWIMKNACRRMISHKFIPFFMFGWVNNFYLHSAFSLSKSPLSILR